jgi:hypothetical protein
MQRSHDPDQGGFRRPPWAASAGHGNHGEADDRGGAGNRGGAGGRDLELVIAGLERRLDEMTAAQRATRWLLLGGSLALLGTLTWFGLALSKTLRERLSPDKLQAAMLTKVDQVLPPLSEKLVDSAGEVAPVYGELAMKRFEKVRPQLETMVIDESGQFAERVRSTLMKESEAGMKRVTDRVATDLKRQLPALSETKLDAIEKRLRDSLLVAGGEVVEQVEKKFAGERTRIEGLLARLPVDEVAKESEEKLQRNFIHQLLMLIDQAVMAENSPLK